MKKGNRIVGIVLLMLLYISAITPFPVSNNSTFHTNQNKIQKKQIQASISSQKSISIAVDAVKDNVQNNYPTGLKKHSDDLASVEKAYVSQENSKFKQYSAIWHNQLIASRKTDQLFPHHTFG